MSSNKEFLVFKKLILVLVAIALPIKVYPSAINISQCAFVFSELKQHKIISNKIIENIDPENLTPKQARSLTRSTINGYYVMTRILGEGKFTDLMRELPKFKKMGINTIFISPPSLQTTYEMPNGSKNNHGYWISDLSKIDPRQGSLKDLKKLIKEAKSRNIEIALDLVLNHFGYGDTYRIGNRDIHWTDPEFFRPPHLSESFETHKWLENELYDKMENSTNKDELFFLQSKLASYGLHGMPSLRHEHPLVREHLINETEKFINLGFRTFRIDAAKHMDRESLNYLLNKLNKIAASKGVKLTFIIEFLYMKSPVLDVFVKDLLENVTENERMFFFDVPQAQEFRRLTTNDYDFSWLMEFLNFKIRNKHALKQYLPMIEDQDFGTPLGQNKKRVRLVYALTEFTNENSNVLFHGSEKSGSRVESRQAINGINEDGDISKTINAVSVAMSPYRTSEIITPLMTHKALKNVLILERRLSDRSLYFIANKGETKIADFIKRNDASIDFIIKEKLKVGEGKVHKVSSGVSVELEPESFIVIEILNP